MPNSLIYLRTRFYSCIIKLVLRTRIETRAQNISTYQALCILCIKIIFLLTYLLPTLSCRKKLEIHFLAVAFFLTVFYFILLVFGTDSCNVPCLFSSFVIYSGHIFCWASSNVEARSLALLASLFSILFYI